MTVTITDTHQKRVKVLFFWSERIGQRLKSVENFQHGTRKIFFLNLVCRLISLKEATHAWFVRVLIAENIFSRSVGKLVQKWPKYTDKQGDQY